MLIKSLFSHLKGHIRVGSCKGLMKKSQTKLSVINMAQRPICAGVWQGNGKDAQAKTTELSNLTLYSIGDVK